LGVEQGVSSGNWDIVWPSSALAALGLYLVWLRFGEDIRRMLGSVFPWWRRDT